MKAIQREKDAIATRYTDAAMRDIANSLGNYSNGLNPRGLVEGAARAHNIQRNKFRQIGSAPRQAQGGAVNFLNMAMAYKPRRAPRNTASGYFRAASSPSPRPA